MTLKTKSVRMTLITKSHVINYSLQQLFFFRVGRVAFVQIKLHAEKPVYLLPPFMLSYFHFPDHAPFVNFSKSRYQSFSSIYECELSCDLSGMSL